MQTDTLFYRLFQNWPQQAFTLLQLPYVPNSYEFLSEEIKQTGFRIDGVFKPNSDDPEQPVIFVEVQYQPDPQFYGRFFSEIILYLFRQTTSTRWLAFVIYPDRKTGKPKNQRKSPSSLFWNCGKSIVSTWKTSNTALNRVSISSAW
jgi:predicted transposase/invertase (TIGR01784 family)